MPRLVRTIGVTMLVGAIALAAFVVEGCSVMASPKPGTPKTTVAVVLLDLSGSTNTKPVREQYAEDLARVSERIYYGDTLSIWSVDKDSIKNSVSLNTGSPLPMLTMPVSTSTYEQRRLAHEFMQKQPIAALRSALIAPAVAHLSDATQGSDILGAMDVSARQFELSKAPQKWLIVFSDMLMNDQRFDTAKPFDPVKLLAAVKKSEGIPSLKGVTVIVVGAGGRDKEQWARLHEFWVGYFKEAGASLPDANYGTQLPADLVNEINAGVDFTSDPQRLAQ